MINAISQAIAADISWLWISARTLGICAWLASSTAVIAGLVSSTRLTPSAEGRRVVATAHRGAAVLTLVFVVAHIAVLLPDPYAKLTWSDVVLPGLAANHTFATALGTMAFLALVSVVLTSAFRSALPVAVWRRVHVAAYVVWPLASLHFILMGTDVMASWSLFMIGVVGAVLVLLLLRRGFVRASSATTPGTGTAVSKPTIATNSGPGAELLVTDVIDEIADSKTFVFAFPGDRANQFTYQPGQHLTLQIPSDWHAPVARCYSLSSAPGVDPDLRITVKRTPGGYASNWLCDNVVPGMRIRSLAPAGSFTPSSTMDELLLFAGGSGVTPMISMIKAAATNRGLRVTLVYANRDQNSIIFESQLSRLEQRGEGRLVIHHWLQSESGIPTSNMVSAMLNEHRDAEVFVCGPAPFMNLVVTTAQAFGWPELKVHSEVFTSLSGDPFAGGRRPRSTRTAGGTAVLTRTTLAEVHVAGSDHVIDWPSDANLVDAMLDAGIEPPYSCREGICGTCECTLVEGCVSSGSRSHQAGTRVLGCQVRPTSEAVTLRF